MPSSADAFHEALNAILAQWPDASSLRAQAGVPAPGEDRFDDFLFRIAANSIAAGETDAILAFFDGFYGNSPRCVDLLWKLGELMFKRYDYRVARRLYEKASASDPRNAQVLAGLAA